jgi:hypothetical protein
MVEAEFSFTESLEDVMKVFMKYLDRCTYYVLLVKGSLIRLNFPIQEKLNISLSILSFSAAIAT